MKKFYCVSTMTPNKGKVLSAVTSSKMADEKPKSIMKVSKKKNYYWDWFETLEDAHSFVKLSKKK